MEQEGDDVKVNADEKCLFRTMYLRLCEPTCLPYPKRRLLANRVY